MITSVTRKSAFRSVDREPSLDTEPVPERSSEIDIPDAPLNHMLNSGLIVKNFVS